MNEDNSLAYTNQEVSEMIGIADSTLRRWCGLLERSGYEFLKGENGQRAFRDRDVFLLRKMKKLNKQDGMKLENAVNAVMTMDQGTQQTPVVHENQTDRNEILQRLDKQEAFNEALLQRLEERDQYIEKAILERNEQLTQVLEEIRESKKQIAAVKEKKWWKFWK